MRPFRLAMLGAVLLAGACGGEPVLECDDNVAYLAARSMPRVRAPDGLDNLDALREMPLPKASPQAPESTAEPAAEEPGCLERPPLVIGD